MLTIRSLNGVPVTICPDEYRARELVAGMEHHRVTVDHGATHYFRGQYGRGLGAVQPVERYARARLEHDAAELATAWKAGCNA